MAESNPLVPAALRVERSNLCELLEGLAPADWSMQSLCDGWTVKDVAAHLTLSARTSRLDFVKGMIRYRGNFDRMEAERARHRALQFTPAELTDQLRSDIETSATAPGSSPIDVLTDFVVHAQDISIPLGISLTPSTEHVIMALEHVRSSRWYGAKERIGHATLRATDTDWSAGDGPSTMTGTALDLLLMASGRGSAS